MAMQDSGSKRNLKVGPGYELPKELSILALFSDFKVSYRFHTDTDCYTKRFSVQENGGK
jgi:hypothetical protein